jgi:predicted methyltransferase
MEKTFAISYKLRYAETSEWGTEYFKAINKQQALNNFAKTRKISTKKFNSYNDWQWEEGVWLAEFWNIKQVREITCPHCGGNGIIHT